MGLSVKVGTVTEPASTGSVSYTGVGFQPKALVCFAAMRSDAESYTSNLYGVWGLATAAAQVSMFCWSQNGRVAPATPVTYRGHNDGAFIWSNPNATAGTAVLTSMDADGFTLHWTALSPSAYKYNYLALGGDDLTDVYLANFKSPTSTGAVSYTGVGFQPDCIVTLTTALVDPTSATQAAANLFGLGWAIDADNQSAVGFGGMHNTTPTLTNRSQNTNCCVFTPYNDSAWIKGALTAMEADGFRINWSSVQATERNSWAMCLKGARYKCGTFTKPSTTTGEQSITGAGFTPKAMLLQSSSLNSDTVGTHIYNMYGAADGSAMRTAQVADQDNVNTTNCFRANSEVNAHYAHSLLSPGTVVERAELSSFDADGFTVDWKVNQATTRDIHYLLFGDSPPTTRRKNALAGMPF